jgi:hypothetical protein
MRSRWKCTALQYCLFVCLFAETNNSATVTKLKMYRTDPSRAQDWDFTLCAAVLADNYSPHRPRFSHMATTPRHSTQSTSHQLHATLPIVRRST